MIEKAYLMNHPTRGPKRESASWRPGCQIREDQEERNPDQVQDQALQITGRCWWIFWAKNLWTKRRKLMILCFLCCQTRRDYIYMYTNMHIYIHNMNIALKPKFVDRFHQLRIFLNRTLGSVDHRGYHFCR